MKLRKNFVSNSSSSSFICVVPKDYVDLVLNDFYDKNNTELTKFINSIRKNYQLNDKSGHTLNMTVLSHDGYGGSRLGDYFELFMQKLEKYTKDVIVRYF